MDESIVQLDYGWNEIKTVALDVLQKMLEEGLKPGKLFSNTDYSRVYTMCYNMCTQKTPFNWSEQLYERHGCSISDYLAHKVVPILRSLHDEQLLKAFVARADNHAIMNKWYAKFFMYLDRYHVKYHQLASLSDAGVGIYKKLVYNEVKKSVTENLLQLIGQEREGQLIDRDLVKKCVDIYEKMGMGKLDDYEQDFEGPFLEASRDYYARRAVSWMASESTPTYLIKVEKALEEERARVSGYLNASSEPKLLQVMDRELLEKQLMALLEKEGSGCRALLQNHSVADLHRLYYLLLRISNGLEPMAQIFKKYLLDVGQACIEQRLGGQGGESKEGGKESKEAGKDNAEVRENEDAQFIKDFIAIHEKYLAMVSTQFNNHHLFQKALQEAFIELINKDNLINNLSEGSSGKFKSAELMANFCDRLLRKNTTDKLSDSEIEANLEQTVSLFMYLTDKDFFSEVYRNLLAKRLLNQRSASDDMERVMIGKLKSKTGAQFTAKMEGMMTDLAIGMEQSASFEKFCKETPGMLGGKLSFSVQILTTGHWPQYKYYNEIVLPSSMLKCMETFKMYYDNMTNNNKRKLTWVYSLGNVNIKGSFNNFKKTYDINVTTLQAAVMLMFNGISASTGNKDTDLLLSQGIASFAYLQETLNMPEDVLKKVLHSLCFAKFKIVKKISSSEVNRMLGVEGAGEEAKEEKEAKGVKKTDYFQFNDSFSCPMRQIRIPMALLEDGHSAKKVEEDRGYAIEAAIVRTMKSRKQLAHQQLLAEVLSQLAFFKPDPRAVKKHIESLIDRDYLERDPENPSTYKYLA